MPLFITESQVATILCFLRYFECIVITASLYEKILVLYTLSKFYEQK